MQFTKEIRERLLKAGWSEGYEHDVTKYIKIHEVWGCQPPPIVLSFLRKYGGLILEYPHKIVKSHILKLSLNPTDGLQRLNVNICTDLDYKAEIIGTNHLYFLGYFENHMELFMDESGRVYGIFDDLIVKVADTGIEAIEAICNGHEFKKIAE